MEGNSQNAIDQQGENKGRKNKTLLIEGKEISVQIDQSYIEEHHIDIQRTVTSLEEVVKDSSRCIFVDTCLFHSPADYLTATADVNPKHIEPSIIERCYQFNLGLSDLLRRNENISIIESVLEELKQMKHVNTKGLDFVTGKFLEIGEDLESNETYQLIQQNREALELLLTNAHLRSHGIQKGRKEAIFQTLTNTLVEIGKSMPLKKPEAKSDTDERIVSAALTEAIIDGTPITVLSRDQDVFNLFRAAYSLLTTESVEHPLALRMLNHDVRECRFLSIDGIYSEKRVFSSISDNEFIRYLGRPLFRTIVNRIKEIYNSIVPSEFTEEKYKGTEIDVHEAEELNRVKKRKTHDAEQADRIKKRKTVVMGGRSISVVEGTDSYNVNRKKFKTIRGMFKGSYSRAFKREFADVLELERCLEPPLNEKPAIEYPKKVEVPLEVTKFIRDTLPKYQQSSDPQLVEEERDYCRKTARYFLADKRRLRALGIKEYDETQLCKNFIEFSLFARTVRGSEKGRVDVRDFLSVLNPERNLDYNKMCQWANGDYSAQIGRTSIEPLDDLFSQFENFIDYTIAIKYPDQEQNSLLRNRAISLLEEAVVKYGIHGGNLDVNLKLALQHIEYGLQSAYTEIQRAEKRGYSQGRKDSSPPNVQEIAEVIA